MPTSEIRAAQVSDRVKTIRKCNRQIINTLNLPFQKLNTLNLYRPDKTDTAGFSIIKYNEDNLSAFLAALHPVEKERYETFAHSKRKNSYLLGRVAAKHAISNFLKINIKPNEVHIDSGVFSFPVVRFSHPVQVSISHCQNIAIALAYDESHPLGVDLEQIDEKKADVIKSGLNPEELQLARSLNIAESVALTIIWSARESVSKILKTGITIDFKWLEINKLSSNGRTYESQFSQLMQYKVLSCISGAYVCSVALPRNTTVNIETLWQQLDTTLQST